VTLHRLDLQLSAGQDGRGAGSDRPSTGGTRRGSASGALGADDDLSTDDELLVATVTRGRDGALVDIQA
jgi:hypothetical protein